MVGVEADRVTERQLQQLCTSGKCVLEDMDEVQKQPGNGLGRGSELVCQSPAPRLPCFPIILTCHRLKDYDVTWLYGPCKLAR